MMRPLTHDHNNTRRIMFLFVLFDLPTKTANDKKAYTLFRKRLKYAGFQMLQYSVYIRDCASNESAERHTSIIKKIAPERGVVHVLRVTNKQVVNMETVICTRKRVPKVAPRRQLTLF